MNLASEPYPFELLTPCLCHGASPDGPAEMRVASVRGQIRQWQRTIAESATVDRIWGATEGQNAGSSKVSLCLDRHETSTTSCRLLPHTDPNSRDYQVRRKAESTKSAIPAGRTFTLTLRRLPGCTKPDWDAAQNAVKLWLLIGGLGLRCNRAAGSVWPLGDGAPQTEADLGSRLRELGCRWAVSLAEAALGATADTLRCAASDTVDGHQDVFGAIRPRRMPSPVRMKVIRLGQAYRLLLAARQAGTLDQARRLLAGKPLGQVSWQPVFRP
jgi:hypothetical protein